jgi:hypothetical protein
MRVKKATKKRFDSFGRRGETDDQLLNRLLDGISLMNYLLDDISLTDFKKKREEERK